MRKDVAAALRWLQEIDDHSLRQAQMSSSIIRHPNYVRLHQTSPNFAMIALLQGYYHGMQGDWLPHSLVYQDFFLKTPVMGLARDFFIIFRPDQRRACLSI